MKFSYYFPSEGEGPENATEFHEVYDKEDSEVLLKYPCDLAHDAFDHCWYCENGSEWLRSGATMCLLVDGEEIGVCTLDLEMEPLFHVAWISRKGPNELGKK